MMRSARHRERGQVLPLMALSIATLLGFAAFAVDAGYLRYEQRIEQSAADSAAIAGAAELNYAGSDYAAAAKAASAQNGFTDDGTDTIVQVTNPPSDGPYAGNTEAVQVSVKVKHPTFFANVFGESHEWVTATAVGLLKPSAGPDCVYVLEPSSTTTVNGGDDLMPTCGMIMNGALRANGGTIDASNIGVAGNIRSNSTSFPEATPAPSLQVEDPCASIVGCAYLQSNPPQSSPCNYNNYLANGGDSVWLNPGVYCGTTIFSGTTHINFNPGLYVFTGNVISNGIKDYNGTGVTLAMVGSGSFTFNGSAINMTAPTSGNYENMLFYAPDSTSSVLNGGAGTMSGVIYFPKASLTFNGTSSSYYVLVSGTLTQNGAISISGPGSGGGFIREGVLVQ